MSKITLEEINQQLSLMGWECLSPTYTNLKTVMQFRCNEGHLVESTWEKLRNHIVCPVCKKSFGKRIANMDAIPKGKEYRILALDQSSHKTGYSVYDGDKLISYGVFESSGKDFQDRLQNICDWLDSMIDAWKPDEVGLEETQYNAQSGMGHDVFKILTQVMGALMIVILRNRCKLNTVLIATWRHHCGVKGNHRADQKRSAQLLVKKWYDVSVTDDESDAICIGKYFAETHPTKNVVIGEWE